MAMGAAAVAVTSAKAQSKVAGKAFSNVADLTHVVSPSFPVYPGAAQMRQEVLVTVKANGFYKSTLIMDEHTGTHVDAPAHFIDGAPTAETIAADKLIAPLAVIDIRSAAARNADAEVMPDDILAWERQHGRLPSGAFVAMNSGWDAKAADPKAFINLDASKVQHYPGFSPAAAEFLVKERNIVGIGVDTLSQDFGASTTFKTHVTILGAGKYGVENLANLGSAPPAGAMVIVAGPKHKGASGGPARVMAIW
jgi:kynurenine formamidase